MAATRIVVQNNGSLRVEGDFEIVDQEGRPFGLAGRTRVSLCRCGQSKNKPFCDSAHKTCGFESVTMAFDLPAPQPAAPAPSGAPPTLPAPPTPPKPGA
jgi:CDGSH-type Zn-finger protein